MLNPHSSQAQYLLGACFNTRSFLYDPEKATACLEKAVGLDPDLADAWYELTKIARELREYGRAARYFHRALKAGLSDPEAYIESYRHFSRFRETTDYPRMNRNLPFVARAWAYAFERGARVFMKTRAESRSEMTSIVLELDSIPPVLMSEVAIELWRQGHTASAIDFYVKSAINSHGFPRQFYEQVQSAHPTFVNAYIDLAALMYSYPRGGAYAVALLRKAIDIEPTREDLYLKVSSLYRQIGSLDSAAMYLERCLAMSNSGMTSWGAFRQLGWIYARNRSFVKYYNLYSRAKGSQKDAVLDGILDYSYRGDQIDSSIIRRLYENLISGDNESNSKVYSYLALHYGMRGAFLSELRYRERAFQSDPSNVEAGRALVRAYQQGGKYDRAIGVCESMMGMSPRDVETLFSMAALLGKTGRSTDASRCYDRINELNPDEAEKCFWKAVELTPLRSPTQVLFFPNVITTPSFDRQGRRIDPADISDLLYQRAARLGHIAAQDTLRRRNVSW